MSRDFAGNQQEIQTMSQAKEKRTIHPPPLSHAVSEFPQDFQNDEPLSRAGETVEV